MRDLAWVSALMALTCGFAAPGMAGTLFTVTVEQGGTQPGQVASIRFPIQYSGNLTYEQNAIFTDDVFTKADVGRTLTITRATDPNFNAIVSKMTDGIPQAIIFWFVPSPAVNISGSGINESFVLFGKQSDPTIDLHGNQISSFSLTLNSLQINNSTTDSSFNASITFSAAIPEPGASVGLALLLLSLGGRHLGRKLGCRGFLEQG